MIGEKPKPQNFISKDESNDGTKVLYKYENEEKILWDHDIDSSYHKEVDWRKRVNQYTDMLLDTTNYSETNIDRKIVKKFDIQSVMDYRNTLF